MEDMHLELKPGKTSDYEYTEAVKTLRTNIQFCGSSVRVIMFTSAIPSEGKSDLSFATAEALAQIGKRTLLIDADIRKSILTYRYQLKNKLNGLSQFLSGQKRLEEVLYTTSTRGLDLIFAGPFSPNPAELLEEELFGDTVQKLREAYDYIIIGTPFHSRKRQPRKAFFPDLNRLPVDQKTPLPYSAPRRHDDFRSLPLHPSAPGTALQIRLKHCRPNTSGCDP